MARPRKVPIAVTLDERQTVISKKIADYEDEVSALKAKISDLKKELHGISREKEELSLKELHDAIKTSGKSVDQWLGEIKSK